MYTGQEAMTAGLADEIVNYADAIEVMANALNPKPELLMTKSTTSLDSEASLDIPEPTLSAEQISATAASNELARVMSIIGCEEAKGRDEQARALAGIPGMTLEQAKAVLAAAPQTAHARTETTLDSLMNNESPEPVNDIPAQQHGSNANVALLVAAGKSISSGAL